jgi:site-specific DNA recombinase
MRAAIYARKSTEQNDVPEDQKSVTRQIEGARAFIATKGWSLDEMHVYTDDGISGTLFTGRPAFQRMMRDAEAMSFDALVFFDLDRLGRNGRRSMDTLHTLADFGVSIWDWSTGQELELNSLAGETMAFMRTRFNQEYQESNRKHARASARRKAEQGLVTGGKTFGYDNQRIAKGKTVRVINPVEAAVVREIFERAAAGEGIRSIAEALNRVKAPSPRAQQGRWSAWSASTVRDVLRRPLYRGEVLWGKTSSKYGRELPRGDKREKAQLPMPEDTWVRLAPDESLRIIDHGLAARVDAVHQDRRTRYFKALGTDGGRVPERSHGKYLLTGGMLLCPTCGGNFEAIKFPRPAYVCATRRRKPLSCPNHLMLPMEDADTIVLDMVEGEVLGMRFIEELLAMVDKGQVEDTAHLTAERERLRGEVENLVGSIAAGVPAETIAPGIRARELEISRLEARLRAPRPEAPRIDELRTALLQRAEDWRQTLRSEPSMARVLIRRLIGPLVLHDESQRPDFIEAVADVRTGLLDGLAPHNMLASPTGFEPVFWP